MFNNLRDYNEIVTGLAQLVEHWSPKPGVGSSSLSTRAILKRGEKPVPSIVEGSLSTCEKVNEVEKPHE